MLRAVPSDSLELVSDMSDITRILSAIEQGDPKASEQLEAPVGALLDRCEGLLQRHLGP